MELNTDYVWHEVIFLGYFFILGKEPSHLVTIETSQISHLVSKLREQKGSE